MASDIMGYVVKIILIILVVVIAVFAFYYFDAGGTLDDLLPDFTKTEHSIEYSEEVKLLNPGALEYFIYGDNADIYAKYSITEIQSGNEIKKVAKWEWYKDFNNRFRTSARDSGIIYSSASNKNSPNYKLLGPNNKRFIDSLANSNAEEGLKIIVSRVIQNAEGNDLGEGNVRLDIYLNQDRSTPVLSYDSEDKNLQDLDFLIIKLNQISKSKLE